VITTSRKVAEAVNREVTQQLEGLSRQAVAAECLENRGVIVVVADMEEAIRLANLYAPEHLSLMVAGASGYLDKVSHAGCVFVGGESSVVLGDYVAGPSHALPTGGTARFSSPLNVCDFVKFINVVDIAEANLKKLGKAAMVIAEAEGFQAHARAVQKRLEQMER